MASFHERIHREQEREEDEEEEKEGCLSLLCFTCTFRRDGGARQWTRLRDEDCGRDKWFQSKCKRAKEILLETIGGNKWRTSMYKFKLQKIRLRRRKTPVCGYDPASYALNFDDGNDRGVSDSVVHIGIHSMKSLSLL